MEINSKMADLGNAYIEGRVAAVHIDLQSSEYLEASHSFFPNPMDVVFPTVNKFAESLRERDVENCWVAFTGRWDKRPCRDFAIHATANQGKKLIQEEALHESIKVRRDEYLFEKDAQSALKIDNSPLLMHLRERGIDTLILDGVKYNFCVLKTAFSALDQGFKVYLPLDATNCPSIDFNSFAMGCSIMRGSAGTKDMIFTNVGEVTSTLQAVMDVREDPRAVKFG